MLRIVASDGVGVYSVPGPIKYCISQHGGADSPAFQGSEDRVTNRLGKSVVRDQKCSFCELPVKFTVSGDALRVDCACCGDYLLSGSADTVLSHWEYPLEFWASASYQIRRMENRGGPPLMVDALKVMLARPLPRPAEVLDDVVVWLATHSAWPGATFRIQYPQFRAIFGAVDKSAFNYYVTWLHETGWIDGVATDTSEGASMIDVRLTPAGWEHYKFLTTASTYSRQAFMAMAFGKEELDSVFDNCLVPAVAQTGYQLRRTKDGQTAGLIDDMMRVQLRLSRFVVCDLTHQNRGAYWEAGFGEALGKPVIYTCRADVFAHADPEIRPHFDTNHLSYVLWSLEDLPSAADKLKAMIRSTLPSEAKLTD
jgi:hypothetical protein